MIYTYIFKLTKHDHNGEVIGYIKETNELDLLNSWVEGWENDYTANHTNDIFFDQIHAAPAGSPLPAEYITWKQAQDEIEANLRKPILTGKILYNLVKAQLKGNRNVNAMYQINKIFDELFSSILREDEITQDFYDEYKVQLAERCSFSNEVGAQVIDLIQGKSKPVLGSNKINVAEANNIRDAVDVIVTSSYRFSS